MSHEQSNHHESEIDENPTPDAAESGKSLLPQALRDQFYRAFTPGVVAVITFFEDIGIDHPVTPQ